MIYVKQPKPREAATSVVLFEIGHQGPELSGEMFQTNLDSLS